MASSDGDNRFDFVIFGATGFTGQFVVEEMARTIDEEEGRNWAIAGRTMSKCQQVLQKARKVTGKNIDDLPIIIADISIEESIQEMCKRAKVILNCVGPYRFYGATVVRACIENSTHHVDISGEPGFLENMVLLYNEKAKEKLSYIIGACGFDSIPADIGVQYTRQKFDGDLNDIVAYLQILSGKDGVGGNYGTWQSAIHGFANVKETINIRKQLNKMGSRPPKPQHPQKKRPMLSFHPEVEKWCFTFPGSDRSVVRRTQNYLYQHKSQRPVLFEAFVVNSSLFYALLVSFFGAVFGVMASFKFGRTLLETFPRFFSYGGFSKQGPTMKQIKETSFTYTFIGHGYPSHIADPNGLHEDEPIKKIVTRITAAEPGYITTPITMVQAAYTLLEDKDNLPKGGGVFTPGQAFSNTSLIQRLTKHNVTFSVMEE